MMGNEKLLLELNRTINMLMAHPDNEPNSEFADRIDSLIDLKDQLNLPEVSITDRKLNAMAEVVDWFGDTVNTITRATMCDIINRI